MQEDPGRKKSAPTPGGKGRWGTTKYTNLVRNRSSGTYFARFRCQGKLVWKSLETDKITVARLRLPDELAKARKKAHADSRLRTGNKVRFDDLLAAYRQRGWRPARAKTPKDKQALKPASQSYYEQLAGRLYRLWPDLPETEVGALSEATLNAKFDRFRSAMAASVFNHTLGLVRHVLEDGVQCGALHENPAMNVVRESALSRTLELPSTTEFNRFVEAIEGSGSGWSKPCADFVRFMAYGGFRKGEAANVTWADCDFQQRRIKLRGHPETGLKGRKPGEVRIVPMIDEMEALLLNLKKERPDEPPSAPVMQVRECQKAMDSAARKVGIKRLRHHDLRHLFATRAIESGVDIPTVSRWLGHKDGGALAMRVYGHLRDQHSAEMARKVSFSPSPNQAAEARS